MSQPRTRHLEVVDGGGNDVDGPAGYRLEDRLGDGAEGGAWRATDLRDGATVVAKPVPGSAGLSVRAAFEALRRAGAANLPEPRAIVSAAGESTWLITAWVPGSPLQPGPVEPALAFADVAAVARALVALHEAGTHHGDVAPGNVVADGTARTLIDLAQLGRRGVGTPGFLAPEVLAGGGGPAADRFSLGALLVWRLCGETPWARPEALVKVRARADVVGRLQALGLARLPSEAFELIVRLLLPEPSARPASTRGVARRLAALASASGPGVGGGLLWWPPGRWPYVGLPLEAAVTALGSGACRLVAVAGPAGSGRERVVEELISLLQARGQEAWHQDADAWARERGCASGSWLEAWVSASPGAPTVGLSTEPIRAAAAPRVAAACSLARAPVVATAERGAADRLERAPGVVVLRLRPLEQREIVALLSAGVDASGPELDALARAIGEATGGWPAAVVRLADACADAGASAGEVPDVVASPSSAGRTTDAGNMDPGLARAVLRAGWFGPDPTLPPTLAPGGVPLSVARARARRALGGAALRADARAQPAASLSWAIDAEDDAALLERLRAVTPDDPEVARAVRSLEQRDAPAPLLAFAAARRLAEGDAAGAEALARRAPADPACAFERARALQRLGRADEARELLAEEASDAPGLRWAKRGLRWRVWVDQGAVARAADEALGLGVDAVSLDAEAGHGMALALLWAAYAAALGGDASLAGARLGTAGRWASAQSGPAAAAIEARVLQLQGNLAHASGELEHAAGCFAQAAGAFARAGEPVGGLTLRGTSCALAILTLDLATGLEHGRAALRGLLAHGQTSALVEAALNLVQLLRRVGGVDEARAVGEAVEAACGADPSSIVRARRRRLRADVLAADPSARADAAVALAYAAAAAELERAHCGAEALDAWLEAATRFATLGRRESAAAVLDHLGALPAPTDPVARVLLAARVVLVTAALRSDARLDAALGALRDGLRVDALRQARRLDAAILFDRALLAALRRREQPVATRRAVARRLLASVELVMTKTRPDDRSAARASLLADGGDTRALRELLEDLEGQGVAAPGPSTDPRPVREEADTDIRYARLLRMYRRFAREDRLEPLLEQVIDAVMELTDAERGAVVVRRDGTQGLHVTRELGAGSEGAAYSRSVIATVLESGEPVLSVDAAADERFDDSRSISHLNLRSVLAVPLRFRGELLGAVYVDHRLRRGNFGEDDLAHMEAFSDLAALAVAHAAALEDLEAKTCALTTSSKELAALLEQREAEVLALREDARRQAPPSDGYRGIIGTSPRMQAVFRLIDRIADADVPVVIHGESGTGKELVARALHDAGGRAKGPFIAENCGAIPETLLESVLFGHAKGAFTGAHAAKPGLFEAADGGTIFLDEVSEMSMPMQTKLLRVLQEGELRRVGETASRTIDVRVVAASNRDLEAMVEEGSFRRDLYYRINVVRVELPPLRDRPQDIAPLIEHFFARHGAQPLALAPSVCRALRGFDWPGNVRQLENEVQRWIALCEGAVGPADLSPPIAGVRTLGAIDPDDLRIRPRVDQMERELIARALEQTGNNQTQAAQLLGLSRYGLQKKLKRLEVQSG